MKTHMKLAAVVLGLLAVCYFPYEAVGRLQAEAADLTIYAYDSFVSEWGPGPKVIPKFERKYGVKVEVILEVRDGEDRTSKRNRRTGKVLSEGGVDVIYDPLFKTTHAKVMVVDGRLTLVGSTNWTYYALTNNHEVSVLIRSKEVAKEMADYFDRVKSTGSKSP